MSYINAILWNICYSAYHEDNIVNKIEPRVTVSPSSWQYVLSHAKLCLVYIMSKPSPEFENTKCNEKLTHAQTSLAQNYIDLPSFTDPQSSFAANQNSNGYSYQKRHSNHRWHDNYPGCSTTFYKIHVL